jgi:hypothetical protein
MIRRLILATIIISVLSAAAGAVEWYNSSASGIPGRSIRGTAGPGSDGWSLSIEYFEDREVRSLYLNGSRHSSLVFFRSGGRLAAREELDAEGGTISRVDYAYDSEGNPRAIYIAVGNESTGYSHVEANTEINADGVVRRHSEGTDGSWRVTDLNSAGGPLNRTTLEAGIVVEESIWNRNDDGSLNEEIHQSGDEIRRSRYDSGGRLLEETTTRSNSVVLLRSYTWSGENLTRVEERGEGRVVVREMKWSGDQMIAESRTVDGIIASRIEWKSDDERIETLYRDGLAVIRVFWTDDVRRREEFLRDGAIVRVREDGA